MVILKIHILGEFLLVMSIKAGIKSLVYIISIYRKNAMRKYITFLS